MNEAKLVTAMIRAIGDDPDREGLTDTPSRVVASWREMFSGYREDPAALITTFDEPCDEIIAIRGIDYFSTCEHHLLPFYGTVSIAYLPSEVGVLGLSKFPRLVQHVSRKLQIQERLTQDLANLVKRYLRPRGLLIVVNGKHLCAVMRGVRAANAELVTSYVSGAFKTSHSARREAMELISR
jgi:GTP cyclohydrolase I